MEYRGGTRGIPLLLDDGNVARSRTCTQNGQQDIPVLMTVCEGFKSDKTGMHRVSPTLVRLQALNDCNCIKGYIPQSLSTQFIVKGVTRVHDGELMRSFGFFVPKAQEFAYQIIKAGMGGLQNVANEVRNGFRNRTTWDERSPRLRFSIVVLNYLEFGSMCISIPSQFRPSIPRSAVLPNLTSS